MSLAISLTTSSSLLETLFRLEQQILQIDDITQTNGGLISVYRLLPQGYAIVFNATQKIIEYDLSCSLVFNREDVLSYFGPLQLYIKANDSDPWQTVVKQSRFQQEDNGAQWIGIDSEKIKPYAKWINRDNTCGMYCAAALLAYYQDNIEDNLLSETLYKKYSGDGERLIMAMKVYIWSIAIRGTIAYDISVGLNRFFKDYKMNKKLGYKIAAIGNITPTFGIVSSRLSSNIPKPVIVGLYHWLGAPKNYRNHWVMAYSYCEDDQDRYYRVYDNHGRYKAVVNVKWTIGSVRLTRFGK